MGEFMPPMIHGDPEAAVVDILRADALVTALVPAANISTTLQGYNISPETKKWVMVTMEGGWQAKMKTFKPRVDIECYASTRNDAYDIVKTCFAVMIAAFGYRGNGLFICDVRSEMGPTRVPDRQTENFRYICSIRMTVVPG